MEEDLNCKDPISKPEWHKMWPLPPLLEITSPPKGRSIPSKNTHNLSHSSEEGDYENEKTILDEGKSSSGGVTKWPKFSPICPNMHQRCHSKLRRTIQIIKI